ncbi:hypothetical protein [Streptomyces mirabilis]|uniref:hypothetical protein n=1 Tax=Streptomyces mirabilis TaxID=68239 RepID=UPI0033A39FC2
MEFAAHFQQVGDGDVLATLEGALRVRSRTTAPGANSFLAAPATADWNAAGSIGFTAGRREAEPVACVAPGDASGSAVVTAVPEVTQQLAIKSAQQGASTPKRVRRAFRGGLVVGITALAPRDRDHAEKRCAVPFGTIHTTISRYSYRCTPTSTLPRLRWAAGAGAFGRALGATFGRALSAR